MNKEHLKRFKNGLNELKEARGKINSVISDFNKLMIELEVDQDYQNKNKYSNSYELVSDTISRMSMYDAVNKLIDEKINDSELVHKLK
jgi:hypothetical protein